MEGKKSLNNEMKETKLGKIPKNWEVIKLGETAKKVRNSFVDGPFGSDLKASNFLPKGEIRLIQLKNIGDGFFNNDPIKFITEAKFNQLIRHETYPGNIVISKMAEPVGRACLIPPIAKRFLIVADCMRLMVDEDNFDIRFVMYAINSQRIRRQAVRVSSGTTRIRVSLTSMKNLHFPKPPLKEQKKITTILSTVDKAIHSLQRLIDTKQTFKRGLMQGLFSQGFGHTDFKKTKWGLLPQNWEYVKLNDVCSEITIGVVGTATPFYTTKGNGVPYFRSQNVRENRLTQSNVYVQKEFSKNNEKSILRENDILTLQTGFIGISCLVPKEYSGANCHSLLITRTDPDKLLPKYLCQLMNSYFLKKQIRRTSTTGGRDHLLLKDYRKMRIYLPTLKEQKKISNLLSLLDKEIKLYQREFSLYRKQKKGLMQKLLTGKIRVKVN